MDVMKREPKALNAPSYLHPLPHGAALQQGPDAARLHRASGLEASYHHAAQPGTGVPSGRPRGESLVLPPASV